MPSDKPVLLTGTRPEVCLQLCRTSDVARADGNRWRRPDPDTFGLQFGLVFSLVQLCDGCARVSSPSLAVETSRCWLNDGNKQGLSGQEFAEKNGQKGEEAVLGTGGRRHTPMPARPATAAALLLCAMLGVLASYHAPRRVSLSWPRWVFTQSFSYRWFRGHEPRAAHALRQGKRAWQGRCRVVPCDWVLTRPGTRSACP